MLVSRFTKRKHRQIRIFVTKLGFSAIVTATRGNTSHGGQNTFFVVLPSFVIDIGQSMPVSHFLKRNSFGNPKTLLKTPIADTYFCDKT